MDPPLGAAAHRRRIEEQEICPRVGHEPPAALEAIGVGHVAGHALDRLLERQITALADPVAEQVQTEARVAEERQMRAGVRQRDGGVRVTEELSHLVLVGVEELAVEHRVELAVEAEVEEDVELVSAGLARELRDGLADERAMLGPGHCHGLGTTGIAASALSFSRNDGSARVRRYSASLPATMAGRHARNASSG